MKDNILKNATAKKIILIAWLVVCTTAFVYFFIMLIKSTSIGIEQLSYYKVPNAAEIYPGLDVERFIASQMKGIINNICLIIFLAVIYISFLALAIPKVIALFRNHKL